MPARTSSSANTIAPRVDSEPSARDRARVARIIFLLLFLCNAYFFPGGGWNQNARFDQVRALVETGRFAVNDYLSYAAEPASDGRVRLRRIPAAVRTQSPRDRYPINSGDLTFPPGGRIYPNKPPGTTLLGAPAYAMIRWILRQAGADVDDVWPLTLSAWLTGALTVGLLGAAAGAVLFRTSARLFPTIGLRHHAMAALTFGLATMMLPFSTLLIDHVPVAAFLQFAFALLMPISTGRRRSSHVFLAGFFAGAAILTNYTAVLGAACLAAYAVVTLRPRRAIMQCVHPNSRESPVGRVSRPDDSRRGGTSRAEIVGSADPTYIALARRIGCTLMPLAAGAAIPAALLAWYHKACFGGVFLTANAHQPHFFSEPAARWLGMFGHPDVNVLLRLLFSTHRGLFFSSPVLLLCIVGLWRMVRGLGRGRDALLIVAVSAAFLLMNSCFNGWEGGYTFGPRYLIPALPFLALSLAPAFERLPRISVTFAFASAAMMLLATAVDPQPPVGVANPFTDHLLPLMQGRTLSYFGQPVIGPVSANPAGVYERGACAAFPPGSLPAQWNSFNVGEFLFPASRWSMLPLLAVLAAGLVAVLRGTRAPR